MNEISLNKFTCNTDKTWPLSFNEKKNRTMRNLHTDIKLYCIKNLCTGIEAQYGCKYYVFNSTIEMR